jgi:TPR repeat protein
MVQILRWRVLLLCFFSCMSSVALACEVIVSTVERKGIPASSHQGVSSLQLTMSQKGIDAKLIELTRLELVKRLNDSYKELCAEQTDKRLAALADEEFLSPMDKIFMLNMYGTFLTHEQINDILDVIVAGVYNGDIDFIYAYWFYFKHKIFITTTDEHIASIEKAMEALQLPHYFHYPFINIPDKDLSELVAKAQMHPDKEMYLSSRDPNFMYHYGASLLYQNAILAHAYIKKAAIGGHAHAQVLSQVLEFDAIRLDSNKDGKFDNNVAQEIQYFVDKATAIENEFIYRAVLNQARLEKVSQEEIDVIRRTLCTISLSGICGVIEDAVKHAENLSDEFLKYMYEKLSQYGRDGLLGLYKPSLDHAVAMKDNTYVLYRLICTKHECSTLKGAYDEAVCESTLTEIKALLTAIPSARAYAEQVGLVSLLKELAAVSSEKNQYVIARCLTFLERVDEAQALLANHKETPSKYLRAALLLEKKPSAEAHKKGLYYMQQAAQQDDADALCFMAVNYEDIGGYVERILPISFLSAERIARKITAKIKSSNDPYEISRLKFSLGMLIANRQVTSGDSPAYSIDQAISLLNDVKTYSDTALADTKTSEQLAKRIVCTPIAAHVGLGYNKTKATKTIIRLLLERKQIDDAASHLASLVGDDEYELLQHKIARARSIQNLPSKEQINYLLAEDIYKHALAALGAAKVHGEKAHRDAHSLMKKAAGMQHPHAILHTVLLENVEHFKAIQEPSSALEKIVRIVVGMKKSREMLHKLNFPIDQEYKSLLGYSYGQTEKIVSGMTDAAEKAKAEAALTKVFTPIKS